MFQNIMRALGRAAVAVLAGIWNGLILPVLHCIGAALGRLVAAVLPWLIGAAVLGGTVWYLSQTNPALLDQLIQLAIVIAIFITVARWWWRKMFGRPQQNRRRGH